MSNELTVFDPGAFEVKQRMAKAMVASGYFKDAADVAQAIVKIQAGSELGLPPFASMTGIHIIQGKPVLGSNVIATLVKNDPRYDYKVVRCDDEICRLAWAEDGASVGFSEFTIAEAKTAGLAGKQNWKAYPSDMLFARAISRGARRFAPGIFGGSPVYTPDEMGADTDPDGYIEGEIIPDESAKVIDQAPSANGHKPPAPEPAKGAYDSGGTDFYYDPPDDEEFKQVPEPRKPITPPAPTPAMVKRFHALGSEKYGDAWDDKRPELVKAISGRRQDGTAVSSSKDLHRAEMQALIDGMEAKKAEAADAN